MLMKVKSSHNNANEGQVIAVKMLMKVKSEQL